jgi:DNA-binding response OmpR family regulator
VNQNSVDGTGHRILVVDDDLAIRILLEAVLTRVNFEVDLAPDGEAGLRMLEERAYAVVLLDLMMPKINGYEFLKRLRPDASREKPHVIVFTAAGQRGIDRIPPESVCASILKPFDLGPFLDLVDGCLRGHARAAM